ncbi:MAG: T9SS type A sorting domain-containing protein [Chitinophagaceae bacterium]|nr:MAG: T9SS type A sorting domain-containing protein [Chitinophagaceae bacterium]
MVLNHSQEIFPVPCTIREKALLLENKSKFVSLNKFLPILLIVLLSALQSNGQENRGPSPLPAGKYVNLYPNPAITYVTFDFQKSFQRGMTITIFNFLGKKMVETQNVTEKTNIALSDFNRGMYIYHITDASGKLIDTGKFQVSK